MNKKFLSGLNYGLTIPAFILVIISLTTLLSISTELFKNQTVFFAISAFFLIFFSQINISFLKTRAMPIYIASFILLILVLAAGIETRGSVRWLGIFGVSIQFSELLKPFLAVSLASFLAKSRNYSYKVFLTTLGLLTPIAFFIFMQPNLGNTVIYILVVLLTLFIYGFPLRLFLLTMATLGLMIPFFWNFLHRNLSS